LISAVKEYLKENIDDHVIISPWNKKVLPIHLRETYDYHIVKLLDSEFLLLPVLYGNPGIEQVKKHQLTLREYSKLPIVILHKKISTYRRKAYLKNRIPFIVEGGQVYLPFMSLDISQTPKVIVQTSEKFSLLGQQAFLLFLYDVNLKMNATEFAEKFGVSNMSASRALNELNSARLLTYSIGGQTGRSKIYSRLPDDDYFIMGQNYLESPVKRTIYVTKAPTSAFIAGTEALSKLTSINPQKSPVRAIYYKDAGSLDVITNQDRIKEEKPVELQLWKYNPKTFSASEYVDLASLFLSLQGENDERVSQALEGLMREQTWYTG
jgi:DNA-binding transcriptional regulator GbsR (MarR family)